MGKITHALQEHKPSERGRPDLLAAIYETLPESEQRDFLLAITDEGIEATVLAKGLIAADVSEDLNAADPERLAIAIRRLRKGSTKFSKLVAEVLS